MLALSSRTSRRPRLAAADCIVLFANSFSFPSSALAGLTAIDLAADWFRQGLGFRMGRLIVCEAIEGSGHQAVPGDSRSFCSFGLAMGPAEPAVRTCFFVLVSRGSSRNRGTFARAEW